MKKTIYHGSDHIIEKPQYGYASAAKKLSGQCIRRNLDSLTYRHYNAKNKNDDLSLWSTLYSEPLKRSTNCTLELNHSGHFKDVDLWAARAFAWVKKGKR